MDRRNDERVVASGPATVEIDDRTVSGRMVDISRGGACIGCDTMMVSPGSRVWLSIGKIRIRGMVSWAGMNRIGVSFEETMPAATFDAITNAKGVVSSC